jgi:hypothetical protein
MPNPVSDWYASPHPLHTGLSERGNLSMGNTIGIIFGILTFILGILSVAFAWAMWLLTRRENRRREASVVRVSVSDDDWELQRIARDHHGNYVTL